MTSRQGVKVAGGTVCQVGMEQHTERHKQSASRDGRKKKKQEKFEGEKEQIHKDATQQGKTNQWGYTARQAQQQTDRQTDEKDKPILSDRLTSVLFLTHS